MKITLYFINFNDSFYFPFIKKHYGSFCNRIVMYDNYSDDNSYFIAKEIGFEVRLFGYKGQLNDQSYLDVKNHCWKEEKNKADYVIVCDADEFVQPDFLTGTAPKVTGYNMISDNLPKNDIFEINTGELSENYSKQAIFSPTHINEINFVHGCHRNNIQGDIRTTGSCRLFHFRQIGGIDRMLQRHHLYRGRLSKFNLRHNMGHHYGRPEWNSKEMEDFNNAKRIEWGTLKSTAKVLW